MQFFQFEKAEDMFVCCTQDIWLYIKSLRDEYETNVENFLF